MLLVLVLSLHACTLRLHDRAHQCMSLAQPSAQHPQAPHAGFTILLPCMPQKSLLYGGLSDYSKTSPFPEASPATTFSSAAHSYMYFQEEHCMRTDQSTCLKPDDKFYQVGVLCQRSARESVHACFACGVCVEVTQRITQATVLPDARMPAAGDPLWPQRHGHAPDPGGAPAGQRDQRSAHSGQREVGGLLCVLPAVFPADTHLLPQLHSELRCGRGQQLVPGRYAACCDRDSGALPLAC